MALTKHIWSEDIYKGAIAGTSIFVGFFNVVAEEFGTEKAVELLRKLGTNMGTNSGQNYRKELGDQLLDTKKLAELTTGVTNTFGDKVEVVYEKNSIRLRVRCCPFAEAYKALGMDMISGKVICKAMDESFCKAFIKEIAPNGRWELTKCRESFDDYCEEKYMLTK